jgi:2-C-methyl-D-erythritol 4-phosphate cytidylyltransferase/2-C-methyl-D-erythritol 2,4-cyclodiphosphate synthase
MPRTGRRPARVTAWAVVLAAGQGERLGGSTPKAFVELAGRPMLEWSLAALEESSVAGTVLVVPPGMLLEGRRIARPFPSVVAVVEGGPSRQASARRGIAEIPDTVDVIVCHDAARPLAESALFDGVVGALRTTGAAGVVPVVASADTIKRVKKGVVAETVPRSDVGLAQTPQAFLASTLIQAHARAHATGLEGTDDAMLLEASGHRVAVVDGSPTNFKVTTAQDLDRAEEVLATRSRGTKDSVRG